MRRSEWLVAAYFVYLALIIWIKGHREHRPLLAWALALAAAALVVAQLPAGPVGQTIRDWSPGVFLLAGYWLPGRLFVQPDTRLERRLLKFDEMCLGPLATGSGRLPWALGVVFEMAYLLCYPLVPVSFGLLYVTLGGAGRVSDAFWTTVLLAVFFCYGLLPWLPTRPPRALLQNPRTTSSSFIRRLNLTVLNRASIQVNTLPSGHVAASVAAALAVGQFLPVAGVAIGLLAMAIGVGAVVGRYHYVADVVLGALTAWLAFAFTSGAGPFRTLP